jgi:hypothetical protein
LPRALPLEGENPGADDPDLAKIVQLWPTLSEEVRSAIIALVEKR